MEKSFLVDLKLNSGRMHGMKGDNRVGGGECKQAFSCLVNSLINLENKQLVLTEALHSWSLIQLPPHHLLLSFFAIHRNFGRHQRVLNRLCLVKHFSCLDYLVITNYLQLLVSTKKKTYAHNK